MSKKFKVRVIQTFKATRATLMEVEAESLEEAVEKVEEGIVDVPSFDNSGWLTAWELHNEEYEGVP